jgi:hypothetical protein
MCMVSREGDCHFNLLKVGVGQHQFVVRWDTLCFAVGLDMGRVTEGATLINLPHLTAPDLKSVQDLVPEITGATRTSEEGDAATRVVRALRQQGIEIDIKVASSLVEGKGPVETDEQLQAVSDFCTCCVIFVLVV